jgi:hypothetical protein
MKTTIYKLTLTVQKNGYRYIAYKYDAAETIKAYKFSDKLIKKSLFGIIDTMLTNNKTFVQYYTWSLGDDVVRNKELLLAKATETISELLENAKMLTFGLNIELGQKVILD